MKITYHQEIGLFHLQTTEMSYVLGTTKDGRLLHLYWGKALQMDDSLLSLAEERLHLPFDEKTMQRLSDAEFEVPVMEHGDFQLPLLRTILPNGVRSLRLRYQSHEINGEEMVITLRDQAYPFCVQAHYKGWGDLPLLSKWLTVENVGGENIVLDAMKSACFHLPMGHDYRLTHQAGEWGAEYGKQQLMLTQARTVLQNNRLTCTSTNQTPFFALDQDGKATETMGEVFFGVLHLSGNFNITVEREYRKKISVTAGIADEDFQYILKAGERMDTPMFTGGFSPKGFGRMSEIFYDWQLDHLIPRGKKNDKAHAVRPVIYNSWYPYEFNVREDNCLALLDECEKLGVELFVIDDGWMPGRVDSKKGLGDWQPDMARFPRGLSPIADACHEKGMLFGLWVEPEMVNPDSELYRAHPDWVLQDSGRDTALMRNQYILNLARDDIRDWAIAWLDQLIEGYKLDYLKWDMNRYAAEIGWPDAPLAEQKSLAYRYTRNLLKIWKHLNEKYPDLLLENCASGGGRADFGMVPLADRINRSDNADPVDVMILHEDFSMLFIPKMAGGAGNIAPAAHHIHQRPTPLDFRIQWGMTGSMSIGINLLTATEEEKEKLKDGIARFKMLRPDLQDSYVYRIASARENPYAIFQYVRRDRKTFTLFAFAHGMRCWELYMPRFRMQGLIPDGIYQCEDGRKMTGEMLMNFGIALQLKGDCDCKMSVWKLKE